MEISDGMSIEHYAMLNSNNAVLQGVGFAMLKNVMDTQEQMGAELAKMMEQSVNPSLGSNIDYRV